ncbi:hypothetical protein DASB73_033370 [Starmerella bacillaris]|uniref:Protein YAE1 n=1 Tax=Starmerella bacillaris TaxID=1247836 RepID=A0AAV5RLH5_STABA|nr:hypothetical protein DASB73_033370 [Starmerella bacillaris]
MDDDIWNEDGEVPTEAETARHRHVTVGMREGLLTGQDTLLQSQFDNGYAEGAQLGLEIGRIIGILQHFAPDLEKQAMTEITEMSKKDIREFDIQKWKEVAEKIFNEQKEKLSTTEN